LRIAGDLYSLERRSQLATILITGATGFVGSHAVEAFARRGCQVRAVVRASSKTAHLSSFGADAVVAPLDDEGALRRAASGADVVVHLAALTRARNEHAFEATNRIATRTVARAAAAADPRPGRLVYLSSLAAVGPAIDGRPVDRATPPRPLTAYGRSKLAGETACLAVADRLEVAILRAPAVYGPRDRDVYHFFRLARLGVLPVPTGAERWLQMVHATDLAEGIVAAALAPHAGGVYHIAEPQAYTWREMCRHVAAAVGRRARFVPVPAALIAAGGAAAGLLGRFAGPGIFDRDKAREMLAAAWLCETDAAREELGFEARIALPAGLAETAAWYRAAGML
jgi:nucleoside-diphosphate-sugar epimerase